MEEYEHVKPRPLEEGGSLQPPPLTVEAHHMMPPVIVGVPLEPRLVVLSDQSRKVIRFCALQTGVEAVLIVVSFFVELASFVAGVLGAVGSSIIACNCCGQTPSAVMSLVLLNGGAIGFSLLGLVTDVWLIGWKRRVVVGAWVLIGLNILAISIRVYNMYLGTLYRKQLLGGGDRQPSDPYVTEVPAQGGPVQQVQLSMESVPNP